MLSLTGQETGAVARRGMPKTRVQLGIPRFLDIRFVSFLFAIIAISMIFVGVLSIVSDAILPINADATRSTIFIALQSIDQILGFPLPVNQMVNTSITSIGIATSITGLDLLVICRGLRVKSRLALWIAVVTLILAAYFDVVSFLFQGLLGAPMSVPGALINGLVLYVLIKRRELFR